MPVLQDLYSYHSAAVPKSYKCQNNRLKMLLNCFSYFRSVVVKETRWYQKTMFTGLDFSYFTMLYTRLLFFQFPWMTSEPTSHLRATRLKIRPSVISGLRQLSMFTTVVSLCQLSLDSTSSGWPLVLLISFYVLSVVWRHSEPDLGPVLPLEIWPKLIANGLGLVVFNWLLTDFLFLMQ